MSAPLSRHAILADVPGRDEVLLVQPLTGQAALLERPKAEALRDGRDAGLPADTLREAGFTVASPEEDEALRQRAIETWRAEAALTQTQLVVVPTFGCNLACTYCYQELFAPEGAGLATPEAIDALFAYVDRFHLGEGPKPYLTLFGGEPLRDGPVHRDRIGRYLDGARARGLKVAAVTNGHDLEAFVPMLAERGNVKEVQVTLDGPRELHDRRRPRKGGGRTFDRIVAGIDALVRAKVPVNLRVVVDRENLPGLPELARFAAERGWLELPSSRFKTQLGRNYELFGCASRQDQGALYDRVELWARYVELAEAHPELRRFHRPRFHGIGHLAEAGELPPPSFDACPAAKTEWAFSPDGGVYGCTATVGHPRHRLGTYHPAIARDEDAILRWSGRGTLTMPACQGCALAPVCGGGCGAVAWNQTGSERSPDCRPVRELYGLGVRFHGLGA